MTPLANGRIVVWQGGSLWILRVPGNPGGKQQTDLHAHHALQITLALDGEFRLHGEDRSICGPAVLVGADASHAFEPVGLIALLFVEPESSAGRRLSATLLADEPFAAIRETILKDFPARVAAALDDPSLDDERLRQVGRDFVAQLEGGDQPRSIDKRIQTAIDWANANLDRSLGISEAAAHVGLSVDRMSHLFVEQARLPFRTYLLWLRLTKAVEVYAAGHSLTEAAHEAGFSDSAHFSRTFRRMFGVAAAELRLT